MGFFSKIKQRLGRGRDKESASELLDVDPSPLLKREVALIEEYVNEARGELALMEQKQAEQHAAIESMQNELGDYELYAGQALEKGEEDLALEISEKINQLDDMISSHQGELGQLGRDIEQLRLELQKKETQFTEFKRQLSIKRSVQSVQKGVTAVSDRQDS